MRVFNLPLSGLLAGFVISHSACGFEVQSIDGSGNNLDHPDWGKAGIPYQRMASVGYADGISSPAGIYRPGARLISNQLASQEADRPNRRGLSSFVWQWGQFLDHDLDHTDASAEYMPIPVPLADPWFDPRGSGNQLIPFTRSRHTQTNDGKARQQINSISSWIDASNVYGYSRQRAQALRSFTGGRLKTSDGDLLPYNLEQLENAGGHSPALFLAGDIRANEQVGLTAMHTLFVREHNRLAGLIRQRDPDLDDEAIYQRARKIVIAEMQKITFDEFLPALIGRFRVDRYQGYDSSRNATITNEFAAAAYRFGHTMLPDTLLRRDARGRPLPEGDLALQDAFFNPSRLVETGIAAYLKGMSMQAMQEVDNQVVDGVRNFLFGPPGAGGFDLASMNIQRGRDHGLPDYNQLRQDLGLEPAAGFDKISSDPILQGRLLDLYGDVNAVDAWVGGLAEDHLRGSSLGELFTSILMQQMDALRHGDRFWYQNDEFFSTHPRWKRFLRRISLATIIEANTPLHHLQDAVFFLPGAGPNRPHRKNMMKRYRESRPQHSRQ